MSSGLELGERVPHDHVVHFYSQDHELDDAVAAHLGEALRGEAVAIVIATSRRRDAIEARMLDDGVPVAAARRSGRFVGLDAEKALCGFMVDGTPDPRRFEQVVGQVIADANHTGRPVHAFGEMVALLWAQGNVTAAIELEALWNDLAQRRQFSLHCAYPMASIAARDDLHAAGAVCAQHSEVIASGTASHARSTTARGRRRSALFISTPSSVSAARRFVDDTLRTWGSEVSLDDAALVTSELVGNAVRHADSPFRVALERNRSGVRVAIEDTSRSVPLPRESTRPDVDGRGMSLVARLSAQWGSEVADDGKTVWCQLPDHRA